MKKRKVVILGASGRDFHNFNVAYRNDAQTQVVAFTTAQIPISEKRIYPPELAGPLYPNGIEIHPESDLGELVRAQSVDLVVFAYSDVSHEYVMHRASLALAMGTDFLLMGPKSTMIDARCPVISICAVRTGCGKTSIAQYLVKVLREKSLRPVLIRHPMPYGDLSLQRCQRFEMLGDLEKAQCTLEEREEYETHIRAGAIVYAGIDYEMILKEAQEEAGVIVWDGGNNDFPFVKPDLEVVVLDPHRPGHELSYYPGETNLIRADIAVVNKVDTAKPADIEETVANTRRSNPNAKIVEMASPITVENPETIMGKRVLAIEDGPTLTHGGMSEGAAAIAARAYGAAELVDPRPYAVGSIEEAFTRYPHINNVLPALGYSPRQLEELRQTIHATKCDLILLGTPIDLGRILNLKSPVLRVRYEAVETGGELLKRNIGDFIEKNLPGGGPCLK